ncbi:MAG: two-component regulator propeller domain-containing protein [Flavobacteriales bacterium]
MKKCINSFSLVKGRLFLSFCFILALTNLAGQYYQSNQYPYDISDGLPHNEINEIVKDNSGFVWIATENGLSRYDGYNFVNFNSTTHPAIFKDNRIKSIRLHGKFLYVLTNADGLVQLDTKNLLFRKIYASTPLSIAFAGDTTAILFETGNLIVHVNNKRLASRHFNVTNKDNILLYKGNIYLSISNKGIFKIPITKLTKQTFIDVPGEKHGKLLLSKKYGIIHHNGYLVRALKNDVIIDHPEFKGKREITFFQEDAAGSIMYIENYRTFNVKFNKKIVGLLFGEKENYQLKQICRVGEDCFLIASNQGILKISKNPALSENIEDYTLLKEKNLIVRRGIIEQKNTRYFLSYPYIIEQDSNLNYLTNIILPVYDGIIISNDLYFTTEGSGLISIDLTSKKIKNHICPFIGKTESFEDISIYSNNNILLTGGNKVVLYNPKTTKGSASYLKTGTIVHVAVQKKNSNLIYLGTNNGVFRGRINADKKMEFVDLIGKRDIDVRDLLLREDQNEMWLATSNGVFVLDLKTSKITKSYTNANEVSHPKVVKLLEDKNECIWATTYSGITVYNTKRGSIQFLNKNHGLNNNEFNYKSGCLLKDGRMIFGGLNAYEIINPQMLSDYKYTKSFVISGLENVKSENERSFSFYKKGNSINFNTGKEILKIYLSNLDFQYGKGYSFEYSFDSKNWLKTEKNHCILLSNLSYGEYTLNVRMINPFGQLVSEQSLYLNATVPYYERREFLVLIIVLVISLSALFVLFLIRANRIENRTKSKIAMDLHDESGTILTRLLMLSKKEKFEQKERELLQNGLKEAVYSFRTYLDSLSRKKRYFHDLSDELQEFINSISHETTLKIAYNMHFDADQTLRAELFRDIKLSVFEVVTNAIKHSKAANLSISIVQKERLLNIKISDDGFCDLSNFYAMKGNGIGNIKKRISRNNGTFTFYIEEEMTGLTVEFNIPL